MPLGILCPQYRRHWHLLFLGNQWSWWVIFIPFLCTICQNSRNVYFKNYKLIELYYSSHFFSFIESKNVWDQKWTLCVILSNPPDQEEPLRSACPGACSNCFWILTRMETLQPSWATCSRIQLPSWWKVLPDVQMEYSVLQFVPIVSGPVTRQHWKEPGSILLALSLQKGQRDSLCLLQGKEPQLCQPVLTAKMLQLLYHLHASSLDSLHVSLAPASLELDTTPVASPVLSKEEGPPPLVCRQY